MEKVLINLIDKTITNSKSLVDAAAFCGTRQHDARSPNLVEYVRDRSHWDGITIFTDKTLDLVDTVDSKIKVGIILESWVLDPMAYNIALSLQHKFDYIFTYNPNLLNLNPDKFKFNTVGTVTLEPESTKIQNKSKLVSMIYSEKSFLPGHKVRHHLANNVIPKLFSVDFFGLGANNPISRKSEGLSKYMFSIEVENCYLPNYFTEKILDCFAVGTVPIYFGCPNIDNFFNKSGILCFKSDEDLKNILPSLNQDLYNDLMPFIKENYDITMEKYYHQDDNIYKEILRSENRKLK